MAIDFPTLTFASVPEFEAWLEAQSGADAGVWMKIAKKESKEQSISAEEALGAALCFGWIDGQRKSLDGDWFLQKYTPRRARSRWSKRNTEKVAELIAEGRMREGGTKEVERAKSDGRWDAAYAGSATIEIPEDFAAELDANPDAAAFFATLKSSARYAFLFRLHGVKRAQNRAARIESYIALLRDGKTL
ncbi:hypothetical protein AYO38_00800 [bacterium SCGC AG-212-C10]|nr:hypothetical protein AYO38_00800 [bacterium SCGC AG-212-C10]